MSIVEEIESRFLPRFKEAVAALEAEFPHVKLNTWSGPVGSLTEYQGHNMGIDCLLPDAPEDQPDNIALSIGMMHLTTTPKLCNADVCWGAPNAVLEMDLLKEPVPYSPAAVRSVDEQLPELIEALRVALRRGHPLDSSQ